MCAYIIGEIGQNHNGSADIAKLIVDMMARPIMDKLFGDRIRPMDAIKLTKRDLSQEITSAMWNEPYDSPHAFGPTYGEHREALELSAAQHFEIYQYAKEKGFDVIETLCAPRCLEILDFFTPDFLKVASRDLTNLPLLECLAKTRIPIILSTGMAGEEELDRALEIITRHHEQIAILHCVSEYPAQYSNLNLRTIHFLQKKYPDYRIGYSDHTVGISIPVAAVAMGAEIIEKHITIDRRMKGSDQAGSLGPDGVYRMVRDIRNLENAIGRESMWAHQCVDAARRKLERSVASLTALDEGHLLTEDDIHLLSPGDGVRWADREQLLGRRLSRRIEKDELIMPEHVSSRTE